MSLYRLNSFAAFSTDPTTVSDAGFSLDLMSGSAFYNATTPTVDPYLGGTVNPIPTSAAATTSNSILDAISGMVSKIATSAATAGAAALTTNVTSQLTPKPATVAPAATGISNTVILIGAGLAAVVLIMLVMKK
jgi:hypothetical protein